MQEIQNYGIRVVTTGIMIRPNSRKVLKLFRNEISVHARTHAHTQYGDFMNRVFFRFRKARKTKHEVAVKSHGMATVSSSLEISQVIQWLNRKTKTLR